MSETFKPEWFTWYNVGFTDGRLGHPVRQFLDFVENVPGKNKEWKEDYERGWNDGVKEQTPHIVAGPDGDEWEFPNAVEAREFYNKMRDRITIRAKK